VLEGTVDFDNKNAFLDTVAVHLRQARADVTDLRVDTAGLTHCDSSALSALITVHRWATAAGIRLHLDRQPRFLRQMLTLTGLATYLGAPDGQHPAADTC
jgi:ABC-type transporter Mla MlaB component